MIRFPAENKLFRAVRFPAENKRFSRGPFPSAIFRFCFFLVWVALTRSSAHWLQNFSVFLTRLPADSCHNHRAEGQGPDFPESARFSTSRSYVPHAPCTDPGNKGTFGRFAARTFIFSMVTLPPLACHPHGFTKDPEKGAQTEKKRTFDHGRGHMAAPGARSSVFREVTAGKHPLPQIQGIPEVRFSRKPP